MIKRRPVLFYTLLFVALSAILGTVLAYQLDFGALAGWLVAANLVAFLLWGLDKLQARRSGRRVPELVLHLMAVLGATPAALVGMGLFHHKTLKTHFKVLYALLLLIQVAILLSLTVMAKDQ